MKCKSAVIGFSYLFGLICASFLFTEVSLIVGPVLIIAGIILFLAKKRTYGVSLLIAGTAVAVFAVYTLLVYDPLVKLDGEKVTITGTVSEVSRYGSDNAAYEIDTELNGVKTTISLYGTDTDAECGDIIIFDATLSVLKNNANFAEESYYKAKGIFLKAYAQGEISVSDGGFNLKGEISKFSDYIGERISLYLPNEEGEIIKAMFLGDKSGLSQQLKTNIKRSGISHFAAVSGQHLTIITHMIMLLLGLTPLRNCRKIKFLLLAAIILCFMVFFRLSASVVRSGIMLIIFYGGEPLMRKSNTLNSMGLAALIIVLFNPYTCLDTGFLLSLAGTFGIGVIAPYICKRIKPSSIKPALDAAAGAFSASLTTFPLTAVFFGGVSLVGILTSLVLQLLFVPILVCMVFFTFLGGSGSGFMYIAGLCAKLMKELINIFGGLEYSYFPLDYWFVPAVTVISVIFITFVWLSTRSASYTSKSIGIAVCTMAFMITAWHYQNDDKIFVELYSDGSNACLFVRTSNVSFIIASDDSEKIINRIEEYGQNNFLDQFSVICLLDSGNNNTGAIEAFNAQHTVLPAEGNGNFYRFGQLVLYKYDGYAIMEIAGTEIAVSKISQPIEADISVFYGYKKNIPDVASGYQFFASRRIIPEKENQVNFFYSAADYIFSGDGTFTDK